MEFELKEEQRKLISAFFPKAIRLYNGGPRRTILSFLKGALSPHRRNFSLVFSQRRIIVRRDLIRELFKRAYLAIRVRRIERNWFTSQFLERFRCFMFETSTPVILHSDGDVIISDIYKTDSDVVRDVKKEIALLFSGKIYEKPNYKKSFFDTKYLVFVAPITKILHLHNTHCFHSHPAFMAKGEEARLSTSDLTVLLFSTTGCFSASYTLDIARFMHAVKALTGDDFDETGMLRNEKINKIAEALADECSNPKNLKKIYDAVGMPVVGALRTDAGIEVVTKLKIT